jgi:arylsulfatase A-like enzyme
MNNKNILLILTDEERYPPIYENDEIKQFRSEQLKSYDWLRENGVEFHNHYIASAACTPSRASLFTGQYPSLHGLKHTDAVGKTPNDIDWLHPNSLPTMGHYFKQCGYDTAYKGKWHLSHMDLHNNDGSTIQTINEDGSRNLVNEQKYIDANLLEEYGFDEWIGPEPHGAAKINSGTYVDPAYADHMIEWLNNRLLTKNNNPFLLVGCFVNPHDIVLEALWDVYKNEWYDDTVPNIPDSPTINIDHVLTNKPKCQSDYFENYKYYFSNPVFKEKFKKLYYYLHKQVYAQINRVIERLKQMPFFENTIIVVTSDHGEGLMTQGGILQKWHCAYQEIIKIPLVIANYRNEKNVLVTGNINNVLTSHVDIIPTLLGLIGCNYNDFNFNYEFTNYNKLVGKDFSKLITSNKYSDKTDTVLFTTNDEISAGSNQKMYIGRFLPVLGLIFNLNYRPVIQPNNIHTIVTYYNSELWKHSRYYSSSISWKWEMETYNLTSDPLETNNIYNDIDSNTRNYLNSKLSTESMNKLLIPNKVLPFRVKYNNKQRLGFFKRLMLIVRLFRSRGIIHEFKYLFSQGFTKKFKMIFYLLLAILCYNLMKKRFIYCLINRKN